MEYLNKVLGIKTEIKSTIEDLPNYITSRYMIKLALLDDMYHLFVYPKSSIDDVKTLKTHLDEIKKELGDKKYIIQRSKGLGENEADMMSLTTMKKELNYQPIVILSYITSRLKDYLIRERIPFVVDNKQIYLPFLGTYLKEKCDAEIKEEAKILPSSQMLLLYLLLSEKNEIIASKASIDLKLTPTSISRASKQLKSLGLIDYYRTGVQKVIFYKGDPKSLFINAKKYLENPIKKVIFVPNNICKDGLLESNILALSKISLINESNISYYATNSISKWKDVMTERLIDSNHQIALEFWRYDPRRLSKSKQVDILSLALSFKDVHDERIEAEVERMLDDYWMNKNW